MRWGLYYLYQVGTRAGKAAPEEKEAQDVIWKKWMISLKDCNLNSHQTSNCDSRMALYIGAVLFVLYWSEQVSSQSSSLASNANTRVNFNQSNMLSLDALRKLVFYTDYKDNPFNMIRINVKQTFCVKY